MTEQRHTLEYSEVRHILAHEGNARTHSRKQIRQVANSIQAFGFINPLIIDSTGRLLAGHARLAAARFLKMDRVPTIRIDHMSQAQKRAYILADNRLAEASGWSKALVASELALIKAEDPDFDIELTGFDIGAIELKLDQHSAAMLRQEPGFIEAPAGPLVCRRGDLWQLGRHRLYCGDARSRASFLRLMGRSCAQAVFTDPPYNVPVHGHVSGLGSTSHREFEQGSGEMSSTEFTAFLTTTLTHMVKFSIDGSVHFVCMDWRHQLELLTAGSAAYDELLNLCVWAKSNAGMGSLYRSQHELVYVFKRGTRAHINTVELGRHGRNRTNLWSYPGANSSGPDRAEHLGWHPTVKPLEMVADAILDVSRRDGLVLDPFAGSGTTLMAAEKTGRQARVMEIDPLYRDLIVRRFQSSTGEAAVDQEGVPFDIRATAAAAPGDRENARG